MTTKAFYTAINTADMEKTLALYTGHLGFRVAHEVKTPAGRIVVVENDSGARLDIMELPKAPGFHALRTNVDDVEAAAAELRAAGYVVQDPMEISTGRAILVTDPNGVVIDITQHICK